MVVGAVQNGVQGKQDAGACGQVFVVGMNGSGTTMLLDHLSSHSCIYGFKAETRSLPYFLASSSRYGDLALDRNFAALWRDMLDAITGQLRSIEFDPAVPALQRRDAAAVFDHVLCSLAREAGKAVWCEKTPMHVRHISLLAERFPAARFIHIIRDGRDCAASFHRRWGFSPLRTITRWKAAVSEGIEQGRQLGTGRYLEVSYEKITAEPEPVLREILAFLGLPYEPDVMGAARVRPNSTSPTHRQVTRNTRSAETYFTARMVARMERVAGKLIAQLGYECGNPGGDEAVGKLALKWLEFKDDTRRLLTLSLRRGRLFRPSKWSYLFGHLRNAIKQKSMG